MVTFGVRGLIMFRAGGGRDRANMQGKRLKQTNTEDRWQIIILS